jgi:glycolate oxidase
MGKFLNKLSSVGNAGFCKTDSATTLIYSEDASHIQLGKPQAVVFPENVEQVSKVIKLCNEYGVAYVARGSGTGLSGGALPQENSIVIATSRLNSIGPCNPEQRTVECGVGAINSHISRYCLKHNLHFAPDPGSSSISAVGGNIAENAGGPHCLKVGMTVDHVLVLEWVDPSGEIHRTSNKHLLGLLHGSEGTLGVITGAKLSLQLNPASESTLLAMFDSLVDASGSVMKLQHLKPVALELVDKKMLEIVEEAFAFGFPTKHAGALIVEFAGDTAETDAQQAEQVLRDCGAVSISATTDKKQREKLWQCRRRAFGGVGRVAPHYVTMDITVPPGKLPDIVRKVEAVGQKYDVQVATVMHAGDGNLHPGILYHDNKKDAELAADEIIREAIKLGGSVTGEHGVGIEKLKQAEWQLDKSAVEFMHQIKELFDPNDLCNPGKALPKRGSGVECSAVPSSVIKHKDVFAITTPVDVLWKDLAIECSELDPNNSVKDAIKNGLVLLEFWAESRGKLFHSGARVTKDVAGYNLVKLLSGTDLVEIKAVTFSTTPQLYKTEEMLPVELSKGLKKIFGGIDE